MQRSLPWLRASVVDIMGSVFRDVGDLTAARTYFEEVLAIDRHALRPEHPAAAIALTNLANVRAPNGDTAAAFSAYREAYDVLVRVYGQGARHKPRSSQQPGEGHACAAAATRTAAGS